MRTEKERLDRKFPILTATIVTLAVIASMSAGVSSSLIYDRALILDGQYWRLLTSYLVHFDKMHLIFNLTGFALTGCLLESENRVRYTIILIVITVATGLFLFLGKDRMACFGGLSGLVYGLFYFLALQDADRANSWKGIYRSFLVLIPVIIALDINITPSSSQVYLPVWEVHAIGVGGALTIFIIERYMPHRSSDSSFPANQQMGFSTERENPSR